MAVRSQARGNPDTPHRHHQISGHHQISAIRSPDAGTIRSPDVQVVERELGFPVVVKTLRGTRGNGVLLCSSREQFHDLANLLDGAQAGADFIFQQYVSASHDRDVRVLVIDGRAVAAMQRQATDGSFKSNISLGGVGTAIEPPREMANLAIRVAAVLNLEVAGVNILFDDAGYRICEANSSPGFRT